MESRIGKANDGDIVDTGGADLRQFRAVDAQWLLARHPNDCMRCEVNGECRLQNLAANFPGVEDALPCSGIHFAASMWV
jgi:NADH dehydrogenase/NADH:ubiquinone oxidoreductase subunit G